VTQLTRLKRNRGPADENDVIKIFEAIQTEVEQARSNDALL
jgi:hypothetical protein